MMPLKKTIHPTVTAFSGSFYVRSCQERAIKRWLKRKLKARNPDRLRNWLWREIKKAENALEDLRPIKTHPGAGLARRNARMHLQWAKAAKAELKRMHPEVRGGFEPQRGPRRSRVRAGLLSREADAYRSDPEAGKRR